MTTLTRKLTAALKWTLALVALTGATTVLLVVTLLSPWLGLLMSATVAMVIVAVLS